MDLQNMNSQPSVPTYIIYRDIPSDESFGPSATLVFFPPRDSDELFYALRAKYPHLNTHTERMRDATIEFLLDERQRDALSSNVSPTMPSMPETASPWQRSWPSMSSTTLSSPEIATVQTPSLEYSPRPVSMSQGRHPSTAASSEANTPTLDKMTSVFSLSTTEQPKQRVRRKMTDAEKAEYKKRRIVKACDKCAKRKRKCTHSQPEMEVVGGNKSSNKVAKLRASVQPFPALVQKPTTHSHTSSDLEDIGLTDPFNPSLAADGYEDFTLVLDEPMAEINFDDFFNFDDINSFDPSRPSQLDVRDSNAQLPVLDWSSPWLPVALADPTFSQIQNPSFSPGVSVGEGALLLQDALLDQDGLLQDNQPSRGLSYPQLSDLLFPLLPCDADAKPEVVRHPHDIPVMDGQLDGMALKDWLRMQGNNLEVLNGKRKNTVPGQACMQRKPTGSSPLTLSSPTCPSSPSDLPGVGQVPRASLLPSSHVSQLESFLGQSIERLPDPSSELFRLRRRLSFAKVTRLAINGRSTATAALQVNTCPPKAPPHLLQVLHQQQLQVLHQQQLHSVATWLARSIAGDGSMASAADARHHISSAFTVKDARHHGTSALTVKALSDGQVMAKTSPTKGPGPVLSSIRSAKSMALQQLSTTQRLTDPHWGTVTHFPSATSAILGALLLSQLLSIAIDSRFVVAAALLLLAKTLDISSAVTGKERWATVFYRTMRHARRINFVHVGRADALA